MQRWHQSTLVLHPRLCVRESLFHPQIRCYSDKRYESLLRVSGSSHDTRGGPSVQTFRFASNESECDQTACGPTSTTPRSVGPVHSLNRFERSLIATLGQPFLNRLLPRLFLKPLIASHMIAPLLIRASSAICTDLTLHIIAG